MRHQMRAHQRQQVICSEACLGRQVPASWHTVLRRTAALFPAERLQNGCVHRAIAQMRCHLYLTVKKIVVLLHFILMLQSMAAYCDALEI